MRRRPGRNVELVAVAVLVVGLLLATPAAAYHNEDEHITDETAHTLRDGEVRVGLWKVEWGVIEQLDLSTYIVPWFLRAPSALLKWEIWHNSDWSFALKSGLFWMNAQWLIPDETTEAFLFVFPFEGYITWRFADDWSWTLSPVWTQVGVKGAYNADDFKGVAAVSNLQIATTLEWRISRVVALTLHARYLAFQNTTAETQVDIEVDPYTTIEINGAIESDVVDIDYGFSTSLALVLSWECFNLRVGGGWGNYSVPGIHFVVPVRIPYPELDLFWRW